MIKEHLVSLEKAIELLPAGEIVHTFRQGGGGASLLLIGCDHSKESIIKLIEKYGVYQSGKQACAMKHSLVLADPDYLFIETLENINWEEWRKNESTKKSTD